MKSLIITFCSFLIIAQLSAQSEFNYDIDGLTPEYLVRDIDSLSQEELYERCLNWVMETYVKPDEVISMKMENEKFRFQGYRKSIHTHSGFVTNVLDAEYIVDVSFREGKFKFEPLSIKLFMSNSELTHQELTWLTLQSGKGMYKGNGNIANRFQGVPDGISGLFNALLENMTEYVVGNGKEDDNDDW
jgi:hypothetical protein